MVRSILLTVLSLMLCAPMVGCASSPSSDRNSGTYQNRQPAGYSRAGRQYREPRPMNHRRTDTDAIFNACMRERNETYCRNRMGR